MRNKGGDQLRPNIKYSAKLLFTKRVIYVNISNYLYEYILSKHVSRYCKISKNILFHTDIIALFLIKCYLIIRLNDI